MAEVAPTAAAETGEGFSKELVDRLKADLAAKSEEASKLKAFKNAHDDKQRALIATLQPDIQSCVDGLVKDNADYAADMKPIQEWARGCHESTSLETAMPLARVISCASAALKRTREESSVLSDKASTLGATMKELEDLKAADSAKAQRITELETLANERQAANEKLQDELSKAGVLREKFDFSKASSREAGAEKAAEPAPMAVDSALTSVTSNASRGAAVSMEDQLFSFVCGSSNAGGSSRITQSSTAHSMLGSSQGGFESEIASALRGF